MFCILLRSSNIVWPFFCKNISLGSICVERLLVSEIFFVESVASNCLYPVFVTAVFNLRDCFLSKKNNYLNSSSSSMISNFNTKLVSNKLFSGSVMISEVCGCNSPVQQPGEYKRNWSYLLVTSQTFQGHFLSTQG